MAKFAASVVNTGGKFASGVVDTGGQPWAANISENFLKKFETALKVYSGAWGKLIHEKNHKQKISWHCPFKLAEAGPGIDINEIWEGTLVQNNKWYSSNTTISLMEKSFLS